MSFYYTKPSIVRESVLPIASNAYDLGSSTLPFRSAYIATSLIFTATSSDILLNTSDGTDNKRIRLCAGNAFDSGGTRGGGFQIAGNEHGNTGSLDFFAGNVSNAVIRFTTNHSSGDILFQPNTVTAWKFSNGGTLNQDGTNGGDIVFGQTLGIIRQNTSDGSDNKAIRITSGGAFDSGGTRGAGFHMYGNEHANTGQIEFFGGNVAAGNVQFNTNHSSASIAFSLNSSSMLSMIANKILQIFNTTLAPAGTPAASGYLYVESGALKYKGSSGTVTTIAVA